MAWLTRLPVDGHYFWDLFPAFVLGGAGMGLSFVPVTIASLAGVDRSDAGVASGLVNTSRQIGGAIGIAAASAIAATSTSHFSGAPAGSVEALDHGFQTALYTLVGLLVIGALVAAHPRAAETPRAGRATPLTRTVSAEGGRMTTLLDYQSTRRTRQQQVESLLGELDQRRRELYRFKAGGARPAGLRDLKSDYRSVQERLSRVLDAAA